MSEIKMAFTVDEAAAYTGIGRNTIRQLISWKKIPVLHIGRKIIIRRDTLEEFIMKNEKNDLRDKDGIINV
ncbi:MAG: helix-turn-helix domain-containing protein [Lachnospiraceae bacterium]|nr:helix-turn-helix domain-containing protein [Lachnospiraceae bacterium]